MEKYKAKNGFAIRTKLITDWLVKFYVQDFMFYINYKIKEPSLNTVAIEIFHKPTNRQIIVYRSQIVSLKSILEQFLARQLSGVSSTYFSLIPILAQDPSKEFEIAELNQMLENDENEKKKKVIEIKGWKLKLKFNKGEVIMDKLTTKNLLNVMNLTLAKYPPFYFVFEDYKPY